MTIHIVRIPAHLDTKSQVQLGGSVQVFLISTYGNTEPSRVVRTYQRV
jgi:hypothetical protein